MKETLKPFVRIYAVAFILALALFFLFDVSPVITFAVIGCLPLIGSIITSDDDLPGGWSNPDGDEPFPWEMYRALAFFTIVMVLSGVVMSYILSLV